MEKVCLPPIMELKWSSTEMVGGVIIVIVDSSPKVTFFFLCLEGHKGIVGALLPQVYILIKKI